MLLSNYLCIGNKLEKNGTFDPVLNEDSHFFINVQRLKKATTPEFLESYERIRNHFNRIIKLLDKATKKHVSDTFYRQALKMFDFSEVNGVCLGYAKGKSGAGFGDKLESQVISTAYDIVKAGIMDPEFFELLPLFQDNVGPDRLSDMIATLILKDIETYTKRINLELNITKQNYENYHFHNGLLLNPYKGCNVLLVPIEILHKLPVAESWEDIELVASQNSSIRAEMNHEVANEWHKYATVERKAYLKSTIFQNADASKRVLNAYRREELEPFDPHEDFKYFLTKLEQKFENLSFDWKIEDKEIDSYAGAMDILGFFQQWVENNKGWEVIQEAQSRNREKIVQRIIHLSSLSYIKANNLDISCEPDEGRGPVDFKISRGQDTTIIEVKLTSNSQYLHGYEVQIEEYGKAEQTDRLIYGLVDLGNPGKVKKIRELHDRKVDEGLRPPHLIVIDATKKESASRT